MGNDNIGQITVAATTLNRFYYLKDHLGDVKMIINSSGVKDSWNDYYPFGMQMDLRNGTTSADARYKFTGKERDVVETGYDYFGARYYDSRIGRWMSLDLLEDEYPYSSPYVYVQNDPINYFDPDGEDLISVKYNDMTVIVDQMIAGEVYELLKDLYGAGLGNVITQSFRTWEKQDAIYKDYMAHQAAWKADHRYAVPPGNSPHHAGFALDARWNGLTKIQRQLLRQIMKEHQFDWLGNSDRVHYQANPKNYGYKGWRDAIKSNLSYDKTHINNIPSYMPSSASGGGCCGSLHSQGSLKSSPAIPDKTNVPIEPPKQPQKKYPPFV